MNAFPADWPFFTHKAMPFTQFFYNKKNENPSYKLWTRERVNQIELRSSRKVGIFSARKF